MYLARCYLFQFYRMLDLHCWQVAVSNLFSCLEFLFRPFGRVPSDWLRLALRNIPVRTMLWECWNFLNLMKRRGLPRH